MGRADGTNGPERLHPHEKEPKLPARKFVLPMTVILAVSAGMGGSLLISNSVSTLSLQPAHQRTLSRRSGLLFLARMRYRRWG